MFSVISTIFLFSVFQLCRRRCAVVCVRGWTSDFSDGSLHGARGVKNARWMMRRQHVKVRGGDNYHSDRKMDLSVLTMERAIGAVMSLVSLVVFSR